MLKAPTMVYENSNHWVMEVDKGHYEVYKSGLTHSGRVASVQYSNDPEAALKRAIKEADKREVCHA